MKPNATIYKSGKSPSSGEIILELSKFIKAIYFFMRGVGLLFFGLSIFLTIIYFAPIAWEDVKYTFKLEEPLPAIDYSAHIVDANYTLAIKKEAENFGVDPYFSVVIPKINAKSNVIANIDPGNSEEYLEALTRGVAHAKGTSLPGKGGRVFLFSHSTDSPLNFTQFNAVFYLLNKLETGDDIIIYFGDKRYIYNITEQVITSPIDTSWITPKVGEEELVLMTCDPPGTTWNRLLIIAKPISS